MCIEPLENRTYLGKKLFYNFLGSNFVTPKSGHQRERQPVLAPAEKCQVCIQRRPKKIVVKDFRTAHPGPM